MITVPGSGDSGALGQQVQVPGPGDPGARLPGSDPWARYVNPVTGAAGYEHEPEAGS